MKSFIIRQLQKKAKKALQEKKPLIIGVTGSMGKTSTKNAIMTVLQEERSVRGTMGNYNNEIGLPLTILGVESPGSSPFGWLSLLLRTPRSFEMPDILVLEYGADHPGDIRKLTDIAQPDIAVVTGVSHVHAEFYQNVEDVAREKASLVEALSKDGFAVLNADDPLVRSMEDKVAQVELYGHTTADLTAEEMVIKTSQDESFEPGETMAITSAYVADNGAVIGQLHLRNLLGYAPVMSALAAIAVAKRVGIDPMKAITTLNNHLMPTPGRLHPIPGIKGSLIIDDSYNADPAAMMNGLDILGIFQPGEDVDRRIAALGSMAELGRYTEEDHRHVGERVTQVADLFVAVGESMKYAVEAARAAGMTEDQVHHFGTSVEAGRFLDRITEGGDVIYVKGSQSSRMERVTKDLMAEPLRAKELLVRQSDKWLKDE